MQVIGKEIKDGKTVRECACEVDFGKDLDDAVARFGKEVVFTNYRSNAVITARGVIVRGMKAGLSDEEIQAKLSGWKPGVALSRTVDHKAAMKARYKTMTKEERAAYIKELKEMD